MSFLAKLIIDDQEFNVLECSFEVNQQVSSSGIPTSIPLLGNIVVLLDSRSGTDFYAWSIGSAVKSGEIVFFKDETEARDRTLIFEDAFCIGYKETFSSSTTNPMKTRLIISAFRVSVDDTEYEQNREYVNNR